MKVLNSFIDPAIKVLLLSNIWIILFNTLLTYLSFLYPPVVKEQLLRNIAFPNPFKISIYLLLTLGFVITIWLMKKREIIGLKMHSLLKLIILILLILLFMSKLGSYPLAGDKYFYTLRPDKSIYFITISIFLILIAFIIIQASVLFRLFKKSRFYSLFLFGIITIIISIFTFEARFPISGHDYSFFFGPILEIAKGKTIYTDIPMQHGFLSILTFTVLYRLNLLTLPYLPFLIWILYIVQYTLCFYLIFKISKSVGFSFIGIFSIITLNYFSLSDLPISLPQIGAMRWLPSVLTLVLFYKLKRIDSKPFISALALMSLWLVDAGIALLLAYMFTLSIFFLVKKLNLKRLVTAVIFLIISLIFILLSINIFHFILGYKMVQIFRIFHTLNKYASLGIAQLPIESHTYFWLVILIYFASIIYFFKSTNKSEAQNPKSETNLNYQNKNVLNSFNNLNLKDSNIVSSFDIRISNLTLLLFSANLMFFASIYYLGRAHPHNLFNIALLPVLTIFLLFAEAWTALNSQRIKLMFGVLLFLFFIVYPTVMRKITITEMIITKIKSLTSGNVFKSGMDETLSKRYTKERQLINDHLPDNKIAILSNDDTYFFYLTGKKNLLDANPQIGIDTKSDLDHALNNFVKSCPKKIAVDCAVFARCPQSVGFNQSGFFPQSLILADIEKKCTMKYEPIVCTNQLCITRAK